MARQLTWTTVGISAWARESAAVQAQIENATTRLLLVTPPLEHDRIRLEVDRREQVFHRARVESPRRLPHPRVSALASVLDDVVQGRFV